jgi:hypothetical protein
MSSDGSTNPPGGDSGGAAPPAETACRCLLCMVLLLAFADCWCRSAIGCRPVAAGGTVSRPATVCAAFGCALVASALGVADALAPSRAVLQARAVALLAAASACWCVAVVVLRTSLWRAESCCGVTLGRVGRCLPVALVGVLALLAAAASTCRAVAQWPIHGELHLEEPDAELTALLAAPGPGALLLVVLLSGCFAEAEGALSPGETLSLVFAALLAGAAGCVATRFAIHAELANLPKSFGPEALCAALLAFATLCAWCGVRQWVCQRAAGAEVGRRGGMWNNGASSGLGAGLLADDSTDEEGGFKSRLPPTIMKAKPKPESSSAATAEASGAAAGAAAGSPSSRAGAGGIVSGRRAAAAADDSSDEEAQRLASAAARGSSRSRPPRRRSRGENIRRAPVRDGTSDDDDDDDDDDYKDPYADANLDADEDRRRMPPPEPRTNRRTPAAAAAAAAAAAVPQQQDDSEPSEPTPAAAAAAGGSSGLRGGPGAVAAAAMALRRAYRSGRERKKRNAWDGAVSAFGEALKLYQAAVDSGADSAGIALGGGFSSSVRAPACLSACPPARPPACPPACLPACLPIGLVAVVG